MIVKGRRTGTVVSQLGLLSCGAWRFRQSTRIHIRLSSTSSDSQQPLEVAERRFRWWESRMTSIDGSNSTAQNLASSTISGPNWWELPLVDWDEEDRKKREAFAQGHDILGESVVIRSPPQQLTTADGDDSELEKMDKFVLPLIERAENEEEKAYLRQFLGKDCRVGMDFFDIENWSEFWQRLSQDYATKQSAWNKDYQKRVEEKRKERIRENDGVESEIGKVFSPERAEQLWGPNWRNINRKINGYVLEKKNDVYLVEWAVPERKTERIVHHGTADLEPIYPEEYVPDFDEFKYVPDEPMSAETWMTNCINEHPLLVIVDTKNCEEYRKIEAKLQGCQYGTLDLSVTDVPEEDRKKLKDFIVSKTNWPTFPQLFVSATFMGGLENLEAMDEDGSLDTVLVMAGVKQKHIVNKEVDKYNEMIEEAAREWRYKQIDQITKYFQREEAKRATLRQKGGAALADYEKVRESTKSFRESKLEMLKRLQKNDRVDELFFEHYRQRYLEESAIEIERLTGEVQHNREQYLIPDDDERITLPLLYELVQHKYFIKAPVKAKIDSIYRTMFPLEATKRADDNFEAIMEGSEKYSMASGDLSSESEDEAEQRDGSVLEPVSEEEAREAVDGLIDEDLKREWERKEIVELIHEVNSYMEEKWGRIKKKKFYAEHLSKYLSPDLTD